MFNRQSKEYHCLCIHYQLKEVAPNSAIISKAEYVAIIVAVFQAIWMEHVLVDLKHEQTKAMTIY